MLQDIYYIIIWYFGTIFISLAFLPLCQKIFTDFADKGYAASRTLGLIVLSYLSWILSFLRILPNNSFTLWILLIIVLLIGIKFLHNNNSQSNYKLIVFEETLFFISFLIMIIYRVANPNIEGIEKLMDFAILNGLIRGDYLPPQDVWYSGENINYYYFGQYAVSSLIKLTNIPSYVAYNLFLASIFANTAILSFWVVYRITKKYIYSLIAPLLILLGGNFDLFYKLIILKRENYFYADARSLIPHTINEFPAYSFLISDLHAHILDIPNVLLFIGLAINFLLVKKINFLQVLFAALLLGCLYITNSWDYVIYLPLTILIFLLRVLFNRRESLYKTLLIILSIIALSLLLFLPYHINFEAPVRGIGFVDKRSAFNAIFLMFGYLVLTTLLGLISLTLNIEITSQLSNWKSNLKSIFERISLLLKQILYFLINRSELEEKKLKKVLLILLVVYGYFLIAVPEIIYLKDIYSEANPPYFRANTVFKVWYQAWIILSLASAVSLKVTLEKISKYKIVSTVYLGIFVFFTFWIMLYFPYGADYVVGKYVYKGLNGQAYLEERDKDSLQIINWLNKNIKGQPVILQADGDAYTLDTVIPSYTGLPTLVGWRDHEFGWRGEWDPIAFRMGDIQSLYQSNSKGEVEKLVKKYNINYILIGKKEKEKYGQDAGEALRLVSDKVYITPTIELLKTKDSF